MFFNTKNFKVLEAGVQLTTVKQQLHLQNLANYETPGYKSKSLVFDDVLRMAGQSTETADSISAEVITQDNFTIRQDGNNVDLEIESLELYKSYAQYSLLLDKIKGQFSNYSYVINCNMK